MAVTVEGRAGPASRRLAAAGVALILVLAGCGWVAERRLVGRWRTEETPERTLDLFPDRTYALRLTGKGLGFLSELAGPEKGGWRVEGSRLLLTEHDRKGVERTKAWPVDELRSESVVLAQERWRRLEE